jgi:hypothetical protein
LLGRSGADSAAREHIDIICNAFSDLSDHDKFDLLPGRLFQYIATRENSIRAFDASFADSCHRFALDVTPSRPFPLIGSSIFSLAKNRAAVECSSTRKHKSECRPEI